MRTEKPKKKIIKMTWRDLVEMKIKEINKLLSDDTTIRIMNNHLEGPIYMKMKIDDDLE